MPVVRFVYKVAATLSLPWLRRYRFVRGVASRNENGLEGETRSEGEKEREGWGLDAGSYIQYSTLHVPRVLDLM